ncbi:hypothetical protein [Actinokineospora globicatena]|uniref:DUF7919 family protein n=1 Tax=Actinokineospora globicatena TaxID=103729 RepID=UPI0020A42506|nr:hypothetical protein [Actinokineospora globicatena]MCP2304248.1 hypothetical protein [Actinokineospora globicatena]GLW78391.1 hypothetical protein Aglo01_28730 [Actinokineospora globicatena]GLW84945.1 hypothetical protein Aglo02_25850 [Actinokineospora globicatena]
MATYPDLSPYVYTNRFDEDDPEAAPPGTLNVGWIGREQPFPQGPADPELVHALLRLSLTHHVRQMRGMHGCPFCPAHDHVRVPFAESPKDFCLLGSAEIQVEGDGTTYAAPNLVAHYVADHGYQPPAEFVAAVLALK